MSNKKISELELVASNASGDQFALVQNGETMKTTMSKIATFLGTIFTTTTAVTAQISAALVGYATQTFATTAANGAVTTANEYTDTKVALRQLEYDLTSTASGTNVVTIDKISGVATFTQILLRKTSAYYEINNSEIVADDLVELDLFYNGAGYPLIMHYRTELGKIRMHLANIAVDGGSGLDTNASMFISFRKI